MDSISNSGVSLILNPEIANAIDDHQHDLSTCEEEFENQEEIEQMLVNAFDSQSLSNTENDEDDEDRGDDDDDDNHDDENARIPRVTHEPVPKSEENELLRQENALLRGRIAELITKDGVYHQRLRECERETNECHEKSEQKLFALRLDYESRVEHLTHQTSEQQMEILTLRQMYETVYHEKNRADEQISECRVSENALREKCDKLQMEYDYLVKTTKKPSSLVAHTQTDTDDECERKLKESTQRNVQLVDQLRRASDQVQILETRCRDHEQSASLQRIQYEERLKQLSMRPTSESVEIQTDPNDEGERRFKQLQNEIDDHKLKLKGKQMEINTLKFDLDALKQEMNDRLSLLSSNISTDQLNKMISERDQYFVELNQLKTELPELKRQMVDSFQTRVVAFKEQVKKSLVDKENEYRKRIEQIENEYISEYEQVLEKNRQVVKAVVTSKQDDFNAEKIRIIAEYEEKLGALQKQQLPADERRALEQKIEELTRTNDKCSQYIAKRAQEHRQRERTSLTLRDIDETKRKYNDEIRCLYDQIAKQNQQQISLIDEHQSQIDQLKITYDQRYRILLDEWKIYNDDLRDHRTKLKTQLKEYEKTIVQLRYHIINLQIEYLQNGGNSNKMLQITNEIK